MLGKETIDMGYEAYKIAESLDFINLMTYDLHGSWESFTGHHSALYPRKGETDGQELLNVVCIIKCDIYIYMYVCVCGFDYYSNNLRMCTFKLSINRL